MGESHNEVHGAVTGNVIQAHTIHHVHLHYGDESPTAPAPPTKPDRPRGDPPAVPAPTIPTTRQLPPREPPAVRRHVIDPPSRRVLLPGERLPQRDWHQLIGTSAVFVFVLILVVGLGILVIINIHPDPSSSGKGKSIPLELIDRPPPSPPPAGGTLLFADDFKKNSNAWVGLGNRSNGSSAHVDTTAEDLQLTATQGNVLIVSPRPPAADPTWASITRAQVDLQFQQTFSTEKEMPGGGTFSVSCRIAPGGRDGYTLTLLAGDTELIKYADGKRTVLASTGIPLDIGGAHLHMSCVDKNGGVHLRAWEDDEPILDVTDRNHPILKGSPMWLRLDEDDDTGENNDLTIVHAAAYRLR